MTTVVHSAEPSQPRVAITGIGIVSPVGLDVPTTLASLLAGRTGTRDLPASLKADSPVKFAGWLSDFDPAEVVGRKNVKRTARFLQLTLASARQARADAALAQADYHPEQIGTVLGSALGGLEAGLQAVDEFERGGPRAVSPFTLAGCITNMAPGLVAIECGAKGPCYATAAGWASSAHALCHAFDKIRLGRARAMLSGGTDGLSHPFIVSMLERTGHFRGSTDSQRAGAACRPFDPDGSGAVIAEGATVLILEDLACATQRGARIYAELRGYGLSHAPRANASDPASMAAAMLRALRASKLDAHAIDYVQAYGSGNPANDGAEVRAMQHVFGEHKPAIGCSKGATGHMLGASTAFDVSIAALVIGGSELPPIANLRESFRRGELDYVHGSARSQRTTSAMINTFSETGHHASLVLSKYEPEERAS